jgi:hypothetical protein
MKIINDWIEYPWLELVLICLTPFLCIAGIILFPSIFHAQATVNTFWWVVLVLFIDVSHVYSTIYRTYFDRIQWLMHKRELIFIPLLCYLASLLLYQVGIGFFWRFIAYTAVFHFIRQQYGLMKVYDRKNKKKYLIRINTIMVYAATIYPLIYWHCYGPFQFNWFTNQDFLYLQSPIFEQVARILYFFTCGLFLLMHGYFYIKEKVFNLPVFLIVTGTAFSWYLGIVYFKSDLSFTLLNVVCHGIPYMALVWIYAKRNSKHQIQSLLFKSTFKTFGIGLFILVPFLFAFLEEGLWDSLVWLDHSAIFKSFYFLNGLLSPWIKTLLIPFLIVPQLTHYILDGFIWKVSKGHLN